MPGRGGNAEDHGRRSRQEHPGHGLAPWVGDLYQFRIEKVK